MNYGQQGLAHLQTACQHASAQGYYEMGSALYSGLPGVLAEDEKEAFRMFAKAAEQQHSAGACRGAAEAHGQSAWMQGDRPTHVRTRKHMRMQACKKNITHHVYIDPHSGLKVCAFGPLPAHQSR